VNSIVDFETKWNHRVVSWPIMLFTAIFIIWASFTEVDESVHGEGNVVPSGKTKVIQHLEGGIVEEIFIKEGDVVTQNESLFKLSQAFFLSDKQEKEIQLHALYAQEARLQAEINEKKSLHFKKELTKKIPHIIKNELSIFEVNRRSFDEELSILQETVNKKEYQIKEMRNKLQNLETELTIAKENVAIQESLVRQGASSRQMYLAELAKKQSFITESKSLELSIPIVQEELGEARKKYENFKSKEHAKQLKELQEVRIDISKLLKRSEANSDREVRKTITSPVNGTIKKIYFNTLGGIVKPGDPVVEITPMGESLKIIGRIKTSDRARVWIGQKVSVSISAFDFSRYGSLEGTLIAISPDSFTDEKGTSYYEVKIQTNKASFSETELVLPGMSADINILTGKKTVMEYLLKPLKDIQRNALREH
jgi:membrane fusion protein, adhesin transport system